MGPIMRLSTRPALQLKKAPKREPNLTRSMAWSHTVHGIRRGRGRYRTSAIENIVRRSVFPLLLESMRLTHLVFDLVVNFFPREMWPIVQPNYRPDKSNAAFGVRQRFGQFEDDEEGEEENDEEGQPSKRQKGENDDDEADDEDNEDDEALQDDDFSEDDDEMGGDYNAEQYFDGGDDEGDGDGFGDGGGGGGGGDDDYY